MPNATTSLRLGPMVLGWCVLVLLAFVALAFYSQASGEVAPPPRLENATGKSWRLVMAIHPKCPCTRASLSELDRLLTKCPTPPYCEVLIYRPTEETDAWADTLNVQQVKRLPVVYTVDLAGEKASKMGIHTSGGVVLYSPQGEPRFYGGITPSRNHVGDNAGLMAIRTLLRGEDPGIETSPVYGCPIRGLIERL